MAAETEDPLVVLTALCWVLDAIVFWARRRDVAEDTDEKEEAEVRLAPEDTPLLIALPLEVKPPRPSPSPSWQMFLATVWLQDQRPLQSHLQAYWEHPRVRRKEELPG